MLETHAHYKVSHSRHPGKKHGSGHPLPVKHQEKGQIDQSRTGLPLQDNQDDRHDNDGQRHQKVFPPRNIIPVSRHEFGQSQCRGTFGKLGRLQAERPYLYPRMGSLDVSCQKRRDKQQDKQQGINDVCKGVVQLPVKHQKDKAQCQRCSYPYNLHPRTGIE